MKRPASTTKHNMNTSQRARARALLIARDGNACHWCGVQFDEQTPPTIDHVTPRSKLGRNALWNLVLACKPCNSKRGDQ